MSGARRRVRDLLDSLYRGYPSGAILLWETDEKVPLQDFRGESAGQSVPEHATAPRRPAAAYVTFGRDSWRSGKRAAGRKRPIELLFNLDHPEELAVVTEVNEDGSDEEDDEEELIDDEADSSEDELQKRFDRMTFVVATKKLEQLPQWVKVTEVFKTDEDAPFLARAGIEKMQRSTLQEVQPASRAAARHPEVRLPHGHPGAVAVVRRGDRDLRTGQLAGREAAQFRPRACSDHGQVAWCAENLSGIPGRLREDRLRT